MNPSCRRSRLAPLVVVFCVAAGCGPAPGSLQVVAESEETIIDGIPNFQDGWSLTFQRFWVSVGAITVRDATGAVVELPASASGDRVLDLRNAPTTVLLDAPMVPARRYDQVSFRTAAVTASTVFPDSAPATERALMMGHSLWLQATATKAGRTVRINWMFREGWEYRECQRPEGMPGAGVVVTSGGPTRLRLTIHGDHWFWLTLGAEGSPTRFDAIANADTMTAPYQGNGDGETTLAELDRVPIASIPAADGAFDPRGRPVTTLGDYMRYTTGTLGHIDGDGVCESRLIP